MKSPSEMTTDEKLDVLLSEIAEIKQELKILKSSREKSHYSLESAIQDMFRTLRDTITNMDTERYKQFNELHSTIHDLNMKDYELGRKIHDTEKNLGTHIETLEKLTPLNQVIDKLLPWSPVILFGGTAWAIIIYAILK